MEVQKNKINKMQTKDFVTINGLCWDTENLSIKGKELFNHEEALKQAASAGKRLPTKREWESLCALGSTRDEEKEGRWFGSDHELKSDSKESIFLPAAGLRTDNGTLYFVGDYGYYWNSTSGSGYAFYLYFHSGIGIPGVSHYRAAYGFSVRCIAE
jgi:uncharacterized protein (TIGR02145 family)